MIPLGNVLQIDAELQNVVVRNVVSNSPFQVGDLILKVDDHKLSNYSDLTSIIDELKEDDLLKVTIKRNSNTLVLETNKEILEKVNFNNLLSGFATLTYINPKNNEFGAVGHPINIGNTRQIPIKNGSISSTSDINIQKSEKGSVGSMSAKRLQTIGQFTYNTPFGIRGKIVNFNCYHLEKYKIANLDEIKPGNAKVILQDNDGECKKYDIEILEVENQKNPEPKTFKIKISDPDLLRRTGGIVQGMSGTPIIQDDKIIGAVSHAVESNPQTGYGVFIKWMMSNE